LKKLRNQLVSFSLGVTLCLIILYLCTPYKEQIAGIWLGLGVSFYNVLFIGRKLRIAQERAILVQGRKPQGTGMLHRFAMIALAVMMAYKYPHYIDARTMVIGLPLCYIFLFVQQFVEVRREEVSLRKG
jgi:hypothetical protein